LPVAALAALAILLAGDGTADGPGEVNVTAPGDAAVLIDRLRATGTVLTYDLDTRTIRAGDRGGIAVTTRP